MKLFYVNDIVCVDSNLERSRIEPNLSFLFLLLKSAYLTNVNVSVKTDSMKLTC